MDFKKLKESDSPLVGRRTIILKSEYTGESTPSGEKMQKAAAEYLKVNPELMEIETIRQDYGVASATVEIYVYKNIESLKKFSTRFEKPKKAEAKPKAVAIEAKQ